MQRFILFLDLKDDPELIREYEKYHESIPKMRAIIHLPHFDAEILAVSDTRIEKAKIKIR